MRRPSIAWRLAIGLTIMTALLWLGAAAIAGLVMQRELDSAYDQLLEQASCRSPCTASASPAKTMNCASAG